MKNTDQTRRGGPETYEELLRHVKMPTLYNRRLQDITILMYKVKHELHVVPQSISDLFVCTGTRYLLRNSDFVLPSFNTIYGKRPVRFLGPFVLPKLSSDLRNLANLKRAVSWLFYFFLFLSQIFKIYIEVPCSCINCFQATKGTK